MRFASGLRKVFLSERMERMRKVKTRIKTDRFHGDGREGGSLLYVIFFITLLSVFACGFMAVSRYHIKMALKNRAYMEASTKKTWK